MVLKEAYEYQNYLTDLLTEVEAMLTSSNFITTRTETHERSKSNPDAKDETIIAETDMEIKAKPKSVLDLAVKLIDEKGKLADKIAAAKAQSDINIDNAISLNRIQQKMMNVLGIMDRTKSREFVSQGSAYKLNAEGNQVRYFYDIKNVTKINFNRNDVRGLIKKYREECKKRSLAVDAAELSIAVDYDPIWDIDTTLEEILGNE